MFGHNRQIQDTDSDLKALLSTKLMALGTGGQHGSAICERKEARLLQVNVGMKMLSEDKEWSYPRGGPGLSQWGSLVGWWITLPLTLW